MVNNLWKLSELCKRFNGKFTEVIVRLDELSKNVGWVRTAVRLDVTQHFLLLQRFCWVTLSLTAALTQPTRLYFNPHRRRLTTADTQTCNAAFEFVRMKSVQ